jgi:UDP-glucose 4-epimerase
MTRPNLLLLGGAGFIGSHIAKRFQRGGYAVTVIDCLLDGCGGSRKNLEPVIAEMQFIPSNVKDVKELCDLVAQAEVVVDAMAWTCHRSALSDPIRDLRINAESHLHLIPHLHPGQKVIYLGTRSQYGMPDVDAITETTPMIPVDIQGIHKLAAESYFRVYADHQKLTVASLRFSNCFGENQPVSGEDIGLVGGFIRDLIEGRTVEVYGSRRKRVVVYAPDLAEIVWRLCERDLSGFSAFNLGGTEIYIESLVELLIELVGSGAYEIKAMPSDISRIDTGNATLDSAKLNTVIETHPATDLRTALASTIENVKGRLQCPA